MDGATVCEHQNRWLFQIQPHDNIGWPSHLSWLQTMSIPTVWQH